MGALIGYIYIYIYKYISQKVAICSLWTVCPCFLYMLLMKFKYCQMPPIFAGFRKFKINCSYFTDLTRFFFLYIFENLFSIASTN